MRKSFFYVLFILLASFSCENLDIKDDAKEIVRSSDGRTEAHTLQSLMAANTSVTKLVSDMKFTEGPVWLPKDKKLVYSDIPSAKLMEWSEEFGLRLFRKSPNPNGNLLDREGRLLTCRHGARDIVRTEKKR